MAFVQTDAFVGEWYLEVGDGESPETFTRYCEVTSMSGLGQVNDLIDATTVCSGGSRQYIGGLADGQEVTVEANYSQDDTVQSGLITDVKNKTTRNFQVVIEEGSPDKTFSFAAAMLGWTLVPSVDDKNMIQFTFKISGDITIS